MKNFWIYKVVIRGDIDRPPPAISSNEFWIEYDSYPDEREIFPYKKVYEKEWFDTVEEVFNYIEENRFEYLKGSSNECIVFRNVYSYEVGLIEEPCEIYFYSNALRENTL